MPNPVTCSFLLFGVLTAAAPLAGVELSLWDSETVGAGEEVILSAPRPMDIEAGEWRQTGGPRIKISKREGEKLTDAVAVYPAEPGHYEFVYASAKGHEGGRVRGMGRWCRL